MLAKNKFLLFLVIILTFFAIFWAFDNLSRKQMVCWDEGNSIYLGNQLGQALKKHDLRRFWQLSFSQFNYPFLQSWYLAFATLPFEYTIESSRLVSLFLLLPTVMLLWLIARKISGKAFLAILVPLLFLTSPFNLLFFSMTMREGLGTTLSLLAIFLFLLAREKKKSYLYFLCGFGTLLVMLTKYNFGGILIIALGLESGTWFLTEIQNFKKGSERIKKYLLNNMLLYLPLTLGMFFWMIFPINRFSLFFSVIQQYSFPQTKDIFNLNDTTMLGHLLFYPQELAFGYCFSWLVFILLAIGFFYSFKDWKDHRIRIFSIFFLVGFILAERNYMNNQGRYIFTISPFFFLIGGNGILKLWPQIKKIKLQPFIQGLVIPIILLSVFILLKDLLTFPRYITRLGSHEIISAVFYEQDYENISIFDFNRENWPKIPPKPNIEKIPDVMSFIIENIDVNKGINFAGFLNELSPGLTFFYIDKAREKPPRNIFDNFQQYFIAILVEDGTRFDTYAYRIFTNLSSLYEARRVLADKSLTLIKQKEFKDLGLTVTILGK